jgi:hypothetical protein
MKRAIGFGVDDAPLSPLRSLQSPQIMKLDDSPARPNLIGRGKYYRVGEDKMSANPYSRGTSPGRARPHHRGSFLRGHAKVGGRQKGTPNAISPSARKAITAAAKRLARGAPRTRYHWQRVFNHNPLIIEAREHQGQFTQAGALRRRSRPFSMKTFCQDLSAVAMRAIKTDQFVERDLVLCLMLLAGHDRSAFAKFLALTMPKQSYLAARPDAEVVEPWDLVNPGEYRRPPIPEWTQRFDPTLNAWTPVPLDPALTPQDAYHEVCGSPLNPAPGWDWKFDSEIRRYRAIDLRPKTPIPEWTQRFDEQRGVMTPVPVDPRLTPEQAYHPEYGSPLYPAAGWKWEFNPRTQRLLPSIQDEPNRPCQPRFAIPQSRRLYRWHPDQGHFSLVREEDDDGEAYDDNLYTYDTERLLFKRYQPVLKPLPPLPPPKPRQPEPPPRPRFFVRHRDGTYAPVPHRDEYKYRRDDLYEYDAERNQFVRVAKDTP